MRFILNILAAAAGIYSVLILIRIILTWFGNFVSGKPVDILKRITDPYLDWWRKNLKLQVGNLDFSVIAAIVFLSLIQYILFTLSVSDGMSLGHILAVTLLSIWRIISFIIIFFMVVIILRLIAYLTSRNVYSPFWGAVDSISQPVMYKMNRFIYGKKIGGYLQGIIITLIIFAVLLVGGRFLMNYLASLLVKLPV